MSEKLIRALREKAYNDRYRFEVDGEGSIITCSLLDEAADTIAALREQLAARDGEVAKYRTLNAKLIDDFTGTPCEQIRHAQQVEELTKQLRIRSEEFLALREALDETRYGILCPVSGIPQAEPLLDGINKALTDTAQSSLAIRKGIRDEAYEKAALLMDEYLGVHAYCSEQIRALKATP